MACCYLCHVVMIKIFQTINKCTLTGALIKSYPIRITEDEGIAMTVDKIYVVGGAEGRLYIY